MHSGRIGAAVVPEAQLYRKLLLVAGVVIDEISEPKGESSSSESRHVSSVRKTKLGVGQVAARVMN